MRYIISLILWCSSASVFASLDTAMLDQRLEWEYERMRSRDSSKVVELTSSIAAWYLVQDRPTDAMEELERYHHSYADHIDVRFRYHLALAAFFLADYTYALEELSGLYPKNESLRDQVALLKLFCLNYSRQWEQAGRLSDSLHMAFGVNDTTLDHAYSDAQTMKLKKPKRARLLSTFLPGLGQVYAGRPGRGIASFFLTGLCAGYAGFHYATGQFLTATFTGVGFFLRFYQGGRRASFDYAIQRNEELVRRKASLISEIQRQNLASNIPLLNLRELN